MSEFGGLQKHENTRHALVQLGGAALAAAVASNPGKQPKFPERDNKVYKIKLMSLVLRCYKLHIALIPSLYFFCGFVYVLLKFNWIFKGGMKSFEMQLVCLQFMSKPHPLPPPFLPLMFRKLHSVFKGKHGTL